MLEQDVLYIYIYHSCERVGITHISNFLSNNLSDDFGTTGFCEQFLHLRAHNKPCISYTCGLFENLEKTEIIELTIEN